MNWFVLQAGIMEGKSFSKQGFMFAVTPFIFAQSRKIRRMKEISNECEREVRFNLIISVSFSFINIGVAKEQVEHLLNSFLLLRRLPVVKNLSCHKSLACKAQFV